MFERNTAGETPLDRARNPFFETIAQDVVDWLENPSSDDNQEMEFEVDALSATPAARSCHDELGDSFSAVVPPELSRQVDIGGSSSELKREEAEAPLSQRSLPSFPKPMSTEETLVAISTLRKAKSVVAPENKDENPTKTYANRFASNRSRSDDGPSPAQEYATRFASTRAKSDESRRSFSPAKTAYDTDRYASIRSASSGSKEINTETLGQPQPSGVLGVDDVKAQLAVLRSKNAAKRRQRSFEPHLPFEEDTSKPSKTQPAPNDKDDDDDLTHPATMPSRERDGELEASKEQYSSFYRSAMGQAEQHERISALEPHPSQSGISTNTASRRHQPQADAAASEMAQLRLTTPSQAETAASSSTKRPGVVMVNEPAIHPNSAMYRAAYN
ncbi:MAG: hypothetical protein SGARI_004131 [Bacillariaceae sp.]